MTGRVTIAATLVLPVAALIAGGAGAQARGVVPDPRAAPAARQAIESVVADYVGLYTATTLDRWKALFHPGLTVASPQDDGGLRVRDLEEFFKAQKGYFATGRRIGERLENIRIEDGRRIARVTADFVLTDEGEERRGKLGLHLAEGRDGWRIVAIIFSYDVP
jgi:hypothetical protein